MLCWNVSSLRFFFVKKITYLKCVRGGDDSSKGRKKYQIVTLKCERERKTFNNWIKSEWMERYWLAGTWDLNFKPCKFIYATVFSNTVESVFTRIAVNDANLVLKFIAIFFEVTWRSFMCEEHVSAPNPQMWYHNCINCHSGHFIIRDDNIWPDGRSIRTTGDSLAPDAMSFWSLSRKWIDV